MSEISLNASMRNNLLSLQQISKLQDRTQLRLSTGLKVNSAIDNPSSYYTASALNNRADDLSALLDSMGQGIQTIKAANEGIEKATDLVNQMKAIVEQVHTSGTYVPEKEYFINEVGENGAVVSNADELRDAINSGKETICVYGKIDLGDISTSGGLSLQENQKLVGVNYFGNYKDGEGFSSISATASSTATLINIRRTGCLISDLNINYDTSLANSCVILVANPHVITELQNLNIYSPASVAIESWYQGTINIYKNINIIGSKNGLYSNASAIINIYSNADINIVSNQESSIGIRSINSSFINVNSDANINIILENKGTGMYCGNPINMSGNISIKAQRGISITPAGQLKINSDTLIYLNTSEVDIISGTIYGTTPAILEIASGAKLAFEKNGVTKWYEVQKDYRNENTSTTTNNRITAGNVETTLNVAQTSSWQTPADIIEEQQQEAEQKAVEEKKNYETYQKQFNSALSQYDSLIKDSTYKGNNLLLADTLKVNFNEDKSAHLLVQGVDVSSENIGLQSASWESDKDVSSTLSQVLSAKDKIS